jgi:hypothetical protein
MCSQTAMEGVSALGNLGAVLLAIRFPLPGPNPCLGCAKNVTLIERYLQSIAGIAVQNFLLLVDTVDEDR